MIAVLCAVLAFVAPDLAALERQLKDSNDRERREAVVELAKLGDPKAWSFVIDALADPSARVADEAETQLAALRDEKLWKELFGKRGLGSAQEWVAIHAAGVVGRAEADLDVAAIAEALAAREPEVRRRLYASIDARARAGRFTKDAATKKLAAALTAQRKREKDTELAAWSFVAQSALPEPEITKVDFKAMLGGDAPLQSALVVLGDSALRDDLLASAAAPTLAISAHRATRSEVVDMFTRHANAEAARELVAMIEREPNRRLAWRIAEVLERWSGRPNGLKTDAWKQWISTVGDDWRAPDAPKTGPEPRANPEATAQFVGMPVTSGALAILVDFSGSLWMKRDDGKTPKDLVDVELRKTLTSLKPDTLFNVIPYNDAPLPWEKTLQLASKQNVERALKYFEGCKAQGKGAFFEAAQKALEDPRVDTLLVLTDGAPTGGRRWSIERTQEHYAALNRFRHVAVDVLLVDTKPFLEKLWKEFAQSTGGRTMSVRL